MKPKFKVKVNGNWLWLIAKNDEAVALLNGKLAALRPMEIPPQTPEDRAREIATILQITDARCGILKPLESYYPYKK